MTLNKEHIEIMDHTASRAANGYYCGDGVEMQALVREGLMVYAGKTSFSPDLYFELTNKGRETLRNLKTESKT